MNTRKIKPWKQRVDDLYIKYQDMKTSYATQTYPPQKMTVQLSIMKQHFCWMYDLNPLYGYL